MSAVFCGAMRAFADVSEKMPPPTSRLNTEATSSTQSYVSTQPHKVASNRTTVFTAIHLKNSKLTQGASEKGTVRSICGSTWERRRDRRVGKIALWGVSRFVPFRKYCSGDKIKGRRVDISCTGKWRAGTKVSLENWKTLPGETWA